MKIKIEFTKNNEPVPFDYISKLNGYLHKILGNDNKFHDGISLYSTSFLHGGKMDKKTKMLNFSDGGIWYVSSNDGNFILDFINNIYNHIDFAYGMKLSKVEMIKPELINENDLYLFNTKSPILLKERNFETNKNVYYTHEDDLKITSQMMKNIILKKASKIGFEINSDDFFISFNNLYDGSKIKWVKVKSVGNKASACPIFLKTKRKDVAEFIYNVGVGHSTGSGFGFLL